MYCSESYSCVFVSGTECSIYNWAYVILRTRKGKLATGARHKGIWGSGGTGSFILSFQTG
jgi:hypothetical protein